METNQQIVVDVPKSIGYLYEISTEGKWLKTHYLQGTVELPQFYRILLERRSESDFCDLLRVLRPEGFTELRFTSFVGYVDRLEREPILAKEFFELLSKCSELKSLDLSFLNISDEALSALRGLRSLEMLDLDYCQLTGTGLTGYFPNLKQLYMTGTFLNDDGMEKVLNIRALEELQIRNTKISNDGLKHIGRLPKLQTIDLSYTKVDADLFRHLSNSQSLKSMELSYAFEFSDTAISHASKIQALEKLVIEKGQFSNEGFSDLARCKNLKLLKIDMDIDDLAVFSISSLDKLETLAIKSAKMTSAGVMRLTSLKELKMLILANVDLDRETLTKLCQMENLSVLNLSRCNLNDSALTAFRNSKLTGLSLERMEITDAGVSILRDIADLANLSLYGTLVTDDCIPYLTSLDKLQELDLSFTAVGNKNLNLLKQMKSLKKLNLAHTNVDNNGVEDLMVAILDEDGDDIGDREPRYEKLDIEGSEIDESGFSNLRAAYDSRHDLISEWWEDDD